MESLLGCSGLEKILSLLDPCISAGRAVDRQLRSAMAMLVI